MALHVPKAPGFAQMLKEGAKHFAGLEEAVYRNIGACKEFAETVRSAYGPNGMNKIVINHIEKLFVTNDAATIIRELEVEHPAAKLMVLAAKMQEEEVGDGTNFVVIFCGALLECAEDLLRMGLTPSEVSRGYEKATKVALEELPNLVCHEVKDVRDVELITKVIRPVMMSKQLGHEEFLARLIAQACVSIMPEYTTFNVDNIRVCKILGSGLLSSEVVQGMVFKKHVEGSIGKKTQAKVAVYTCPIDIGTTESKGTVLIKTAEELRNFSEGEETLLEKQIQELKELGVDVVVAGGKVGDMALHFLNKAGIMTVRLNSKFDIRRLCKTVGATALPSLATPLREELGYADRVYTDELGDTSIVVFRLEGSESQVATIVVRGATDHYMDDIERAIDDGVNTFKAVARDGRLLPGAGAVEAGLAKRVKQLAEDSPSIERYACTKWAEAVETLIKALAENSGLKRNETLFAVTQAHENNQPNAGVDIEGLGEHCVLDAHEKGLWDAFLVKEWGIKHATEAADTILRVDQIIMAKRAGGPAARAPGPVDDDD